MTNQELFNINWQWFVVEGHAQSSGSGKCLYRGPNGTKCAIGCALPDELWDEAINSDAYSSLMTQEAIRDFFSDVDVEVAVGLQAAHDTWSPDIGDGPFTEYMEEELRRLAAAYSLEVPAPIPSLV
jgi:hypothetical protein